MAVIAALPDAANPSLSRASLNGLDGINFFSGRASAAAIMNIARYESKYPIKPMSPVAISDPVVLARSRQIASHGSAERQIQ